MFFFCILIIFLTILFIATSTIARFNKNDEKGDIIKRIRLFSAISVVSLCFGTNFLINNDEMPYTVLMCFLFTIAISLFVIVLHVVVLKNKTEKEKGNAIFNMVCAMVCSCALFVLLMLPAGIYKNEQEKTKFICELGEYQSSGYDVYLYGNKVNDDITDDSFLFTKTYHIAVINDTDERIDIEESKINPISKMMVINNTD